MSLFSRVNRQISELTSLLRWLKSIQATHPGLASDLQKTATELQAILEAISALTSHVQQLARTGEVSALTSQLARADEVSALTSQLVGLVEQQARSADELDGWKGNILDLFKSALSADVSYAKRPIRIDFFFQLPEVWPSWETLFIACRGDPRFEVRLILLPFLHDSHTDTGKARAFLADRGVTFLDFSAYDSGINKPDVAFLQNPYDSTRPASVHVDALMANGIRLAYVPYGLEVGGGEDNLRWQYDLDLQRKAWRVFVRSETQKWMYGKQCQSGNNQVVVTGHPKLDRLVKSADPEQVEKIRTAAGHRKVVLWTPHFTVGGDGWSTFELYADHIISLFEAQDELSLLIRPHPLFFGRMRQKGLTDSESEIALKRRFSSPPNVMFDVSEDYSPAFHVSAALMSDAGSFLLEYAATDKPILYLANPMGPGLSASSAFVDSYYQAHNADAIDRFIELVRDGSDPMREQRRDAVRDEYYGMDGLAGVRIRDYVAEAILRQRKSPLELEEKN